MNKNGKGFHSLLFLETYQTAENSIYPENINPLKLKAMKKIGAVRGVLRSMDRLKKDLSLAGPGAFGFSLAA